MSSYSLFKFEYFPEKAKFETVEQGKQTELTTQVNFLDNITDLEEHIFEKYEVNHFQKVNFIGIPYSGGEQIEEVTELHNFDSYVQRQFKILLMKYRKKIADIAVKRINTDNANFKIERQQLDLKKLLKNFSTIYGTYFRDIQLPNVSSSSIYGKDVDASRLFTYFESIGSISNFRTKIDMEGIEYSIGISRDYTITIYSRCREIVALKLILFLKKYLMAVFFKSNPKQESPQ